MMTNPPPPDDLLTSQADIEREHLVRTARLEVVRQTMRERRALAFRYAVVCFLLFACFANLVFVIGGLMHWW